MATGYSVPPSERDVSSADVSASSGSCTAVQGPKKKAKPMPADGAGDGGSCTLPRTGNIVPALAATFCSKASVKLHGQTQSSSESSVSGTTSIASRQRRAATAAARRALAEARLEEIEANNDLAAGSTAGSVGRRMDDVRSDPDDDASHLMVSTEETREHPTSPIQLSERTESASTSEARTPTPTSIYEDFSQRVGNTATNDVFSFNNTFPHCSSPTEYVHGGSWEYLPNYQRSIPTRVAHN